VEAEVGPIKYIAALLYGDNPESGILEKAVRFVIIMIVLVFDPLALCLILSANKQFEWARHGEGGWVHDEDTEDTKIAGWFDRARERAQFWDQQPKPQSEFEGVREPGGEWIQTGPAFDTATVYEPDDGPLTEEQIEAIKETAKNELPTGPVISRQELFAPVTEEPPLPAPVAGRVVSAGGEYVEINGKRMHHKAFDMHSQDAGHAVERHERARLQADNDPAVVGPTSGFGIAFPDSPTKGDTYLRVDRLPTVLYKFNGRDWIEIDKEISNSYVYQDSYIDHLIAKIGSGEYDPDLLSDTEREAIAQRLKNNNPTE
jgi:hypothetical protein